MPNQPTHIFVLVEDTEQQNLVRRYLECCRLPKPRFFPLPHGRGSAEQYVRQQFPIALSNLRSSLGRKVGAMLIVMVDADRVEVQARREQLKGAEPNEPVVVFVPKRHVETWIGALLGHHVNEEQDYKAKFGTATQIRQAAVTLHDWSRPNAPVPGNSPPSLVTALPDWRKVG